MPAKLSALTIRRLRRVKEAILKEPDLYDQQAGNPPAHTCGTRGCILGWAAFFYGPKRKVILNADERRHRKSDFWPDLRVLRTYARGCRYLRLTWEPAFRLWSSEDWPSVFRSRLDRASTGEEEAQVAAERIEHFIKTGGAE